MTLFAIGLTVISLMAPKAAWAQELFVVDGKTELTLEDLQKIYEGARERGTPRDVPGIPGRAIHQVTVQGVPVGPLERGGSGPLRLTDVSFDLLLRRWQEKDPPPGAPKKVLAIMELEVGLSQKAQDWRPSLRVRLAPIHYPSPPLFDTAHIANAGLGFVESNINVPTAGPLAREAFFRNVVCFALREVAAFWRKTPIPIR